MGGELMKYKLIGMPWITRRLISRYKDRLIDIDQKAGTFTSEVSAIIDHIDSILEIEKESK